MKEYSSSRVFGMKGAKTPIGDEGNLRDQRLSKVGMLNLNPRRPVVPHA